MTAPSILIAGAGIAGRLTAAALALDGVDVALIERSSRWPEAAGGIVLPGRALAVLREIGALDMVLAHGQTFDRVRVHDGARTSTVQVPRTGPSDLPVAAATRESVVRDALREVIGSLGIEVRLGTHLLGCTDVDSHVEAELSDGSVENFDIVVIADGPGRDATREQLGIRDVEPPTGFALYRAVVPGTMAEEVPTVSLVGQRTLTVAPVGPDLLGIWVVGSAEPAADENSPAERLRGFLRESGDEAAALAERVGDALAVSVLPVDRMSDDAPRHHGRIVAIGASVHGIPAPLTQSIAQSMEDAVLLARILAAGGEAHAMLAEFDRRRATRVEPVVAASRALADAATDPDGAAWALAGRALRYLGHLD